MRRSWTFFSFMAMFAIVILSACGPDSSVPAATEIQPTSTHVMVTETSVVAPSQVPATLVEAPIDLAGPLMEIGSKYLYVDGSVLAAVPAGPFLMGYNNYADTPEKTVTLGDFWIYTAEVTNSQYALCVNSGKCSPPNAEKNKLYGDYRSMNLPVVGVNYQQSADYCSFVHGRLPTEAEWEKAARGPDGNVFPWGDGAPVCDFLNFNFCKGKALDIKSYAEGVSFYGLFDMSGNVREWAADWYDPNYYVNGVSEDPLGPELGVKRSIRSSSYADSADAAFPAHRFSLKPSESLPDLGFRCVVDDPTYFAPFCEQLAFIGSGPNGAESDCQPKVYCNNVGISISELQCTVGDPDAVTIVNFSVDPAPYDSITMEASGCSAGPGALQYTCLQSAAGPDAKATGKCYDEASCDPVCGAHYTLVGNTCKWDGSGTIGTECLPGTTYDPLLQCCTAAPGAGVDYKVCPDGASSIGGVCVADPTKIVDTALEPITFDSCSPPTTGGCNPQTDPNCQPPTGCQPQTCGGRTPQWCSVTCSCIPATAPCK